MNHSSSLQASFLKSALRSADCPADDTREVAFVGRSNSGKSSTINCLTGSKNLARVSKTPGRTQLINFFDTDAEGRLVDLPGYGYAKASRKKQFEWGAAVDEYLETRQNLVGLVLVMDSRHPLQPFDMRMIEWTQTQDISLLILLNKSDKLNQSEKSKCQRKVQQAIELHQSAHALLFSATKGTGSSAAREAIHKMWS